MSCFCHTCHKEFHHLGIARHRAMHRNRRENCKITYTNGKTYKYDYKNLPQTLKLKKESKQ